MIWLAKSDIPRQWWLDHRRDRRCHRRHRKYRQEGFPPIQILCIIYLFSIIFWFLRFFSFIVPLLLTQNIISHFGTQLFKMTCSSLRAPPPPPLQDCADCSPLFWAGCGQNNALLRGQSHFCWLFSALLWSTSIRRGEVPHRMAYGLCILYGESVFATESHSVSSRLSIAWRPAALPIRPVQLHCKDTPLTFPFSSAKPLWSLLRCGRLSRFVWRSPLDQPSRRTEEWWQGMLLACWSTRKTDIVFFLNHLLRRVIRGRLHVVTVTDATTVAAARFFAIIGARHLVLALRSLLLFHFEAVR